MAVLVSPLVGSPLTALHFTSPVIASSATTVVSAWCRKMVSLAKATPRLTVSQHITAITFGFCFGS